MLSHQAFVMFFALLALYAPVSSLAAYLPVVRPLPRGDHVKLALGRRVESESAGYCRFLRWPMPR